MEEGILYSLKDMVREVEREGSEVPTFIISDDVQFSVSIIKGNGTLNYATRGVGVGGWVIGQPPIPPKVNILPRVNNPLRSIPTKVPGSMDVFPSYREVITKIDSILVVLLGDGACP